MADKAKTKVELQHPTGNFTVTVDEARAAILQKRGYKPTGSVERPAGRQGAKRTTERTETTDKK